AHDDHEPQIEDRAPPKPKRDERAEAGYGDRRADQIRPLRTEARRIQHDARQYRIVDDAKIGTCRGGRSRPCDTSQNRQMDLALPSPLAWILIFRQRITQNENRESAVP